MVNITQNYYDFTNVSASDGILEFTQAVNDMTGGIFMIGVLLAGFVILFVSMKDFGNKEALAGSGFIISIMAIMFTVLDFIPPLVMFFIVIPYGLLFAATVVSN